MFWAEVCRVMCKNPFFDILNGSGKNPENLICNPLKLMVDGVTKLRHHEDGRWRQKIKA